MSDIEIITKRILEDAEKEALAIKATGQQQASVLLDKAKEIALAEEQAEQQKTIVQAEEENRRILIASEMTVRRETLAYKRQLLDKVYQEALAKLVQLDEATWVALITKIVCDNIETGQEAVRFAAQDQKRGAALLPQLNVALKAKGLTAELTLDSTVGDFSGGVVLVGKYTEINASYEALLKSVRDTSETEVATLLF